MLVLVLLLMSSSIFVETYATTLCTTETCRLWNTPISNLKAALRGYNPIIGNRLTGSQSDPGMRNQIFQVFDPTKNEGDGPTGVHTFINYFDDINCQVASETTVVSNYQDYRKQKSGSYSFSEHSEESFGINIPFFSILVNYDKKSSEARSTSTNSNFNVEKNFFQETNGEIYISEARCEIFGVSLAAFETPQFTNDFTAAMRSLHKAATNPTSRRSKKNLKSFISAFGTHFLSESWLGATLTTETRFTSASRSTEERTSRTNCIKEAYGKATSEGVDVREVDVDVKVPLKGAEIGAATTVGGWGANSKNKFESETSKCDSGRNDNSFYSKNSFKRTTIITRGSLPLEDTEEWAKSASENPSVIRFKLKGISDLFRPEWLSKIPLDPSNPEGAKLDADLMYDYFEDALSNYCQIVFGESCPEVKGCGINSMCELGSNCVDDDSASLGFVCEKQDYPLLLNGQPLPLVVEASSSVRVTGGGGGQKTIKIFAIGGGGGGLFGGGGSGYIATGRLTVTDGTVLDVEIGQGGGLYEDGGATKVVGHVVARGGKGSGGVGGSGWSGGGGAGIGSPGDGGNSGGDGQAGRGSSWAEAGGSGEGDQLPDINTSSGRMVAGSGGRGKPYYGGGGGGVLMQDNKHSSWAENDGEGYGAGGGDNSGKNGLVIFY